MHSAHKAYGFAEHVLKLMPDSDRIQLRPLFGGYGLFIDNMMFAIAADDQLYLRAGAQSRSAFEARGLERFVGEQSGGTVMLDFFRAPAEVFVSQEAMEFWVWKARAAAVAHIESVA